MVPSILVTNRILENSPSQMPSISSNSKTLGPLEIGFAIPRVLHRDEEGRHHLGEGLLHKGLRVSGFCVQGAWRERAPEPFQQMLPNPHNPSGLRLSLIRHDFRALGIKTILDY